MWAGLQPVAWKVLPSLPSQSFPVDLSGDLPLLPRVGLSGGRSPSQRNIFLVGTRLLPGKIPLAQVSCGLWPAEGSRASQEREEPCAVLLHAQKSRAGKWCVKV